MGRLFLLVLRIAALLPFLHDAHGQAQVEPPVKQPLFISILGVEGSGHQLMRSLFNAVLSSCTVAGKNPLSTIERGSPSLVQETEFFEQLLGGEENCPFHWDATRFLSDGDDFITWSPNMTIRTQALRQAGFRHRVLFLYRNPIQAAMDSDTRSDCPVVAKRSLEYLRLFVSLGGGMEDHEALFQRSDYRILNYDDLGNHDPDTIIAALEEWTDVQWNVEAREALRQAVPSLWSSPETLRPTQELINEFEAELWDSRIDDFFFDNEQQLLPFTAEPRRGGPLAGVFPGQVSTDPIVEQVPAASLEPLQEKAAELEVESILEEVSVEEEVVEVDVERAPNTYHPSTNLLITGTGSRVDEELSRRLCSCFNGQRLAFFGDSLNRYLRMAFIETADGSTESCNGNTNQKKFPLCVDKEKYQAHNKECRRHRTEPCLNQPTDCCTSDDFSVNVMGDRTWFMGEFEGSTVARLQKEDSPIDVLFSNLLLHELEKKPNLSDKVYVDFLHKWWNETAPLAKTRVWVAGHARFGIESKYAKSQSNKVVMRFNELARKVAEEVGGLYLDVYNTTFGARFDDGTHCDFAANERKLWRIVDLLCEGK